MAPPDDIAPPASAGAGQSAASDLCRNCGLCCDGTLFGGVDLLDEEVEAATANGLYPIVAEGGARFRQPCAQFSGICEIYPGRPLRCREYRCLLLARLQRGEVEEASAHAIVAEARRLAEAADAAGLPGEDRGAARRRWGRAFAATADNRAVIPPVRDADPRWMLAMTALNYFLDRHFRKPRRHKLSVGTERDMMSGDA
jgi:hypothetical protein